MICVAILFFSCFPIFGLLGGIDGCLKIPICEDKAPTDIYLNHSDVGLRELTKSFMSNSSITCLNLAKNGISTIAKEAFDGLPNLRYLNLAQNQNLSCQEVMKTALPSLKSLVLDGCVYRSDSGSESAYATQSSIYGYIFSQQNHTSSTTERPNYETEEKNNRSFTLPELQTLSLRHISWIDHLETFLSALVTPNLKHLNLCASRVTVIKNISSILNLTHLYLDDNEVQNIVGASLQNLQVLSMDRNNIRTLCGSFCYLDGLSTQGMRNLLYLSLESNKIKEIVSDAFEDLKNLRILNLADNEIYGFPKDAFNNMTGLKNLTLDKNKLTSVPSICSLKELQFLSLNENEISYFDETPFCGLPQLIIIELRNNRLTRIADNIFVNLHALAVLDLSSNNITSLTKNWIPANNSLTELRLDGNQFTDLESMALEHAKNVNTLSFRHNHINMIPIQSLVGLPPNISIDVSRDCRPL